VFPRSLRTRASLGGISEFAASHSRRNVSLSHNFDLYMAPSSDPTNLSWKDDKEALI
jgi:hypothetical protein